MQELTPLSITSTSAQRRKKTIDARNGHRRRRFINSAMLNLTGIATIIGLIPLFWIVGYVVIKGGRSINLALFTQMPKPMGLPGGGVLHAIEGTIILTLIAALIAIPLGSLAAFYAAFRPNTPLGVALRFGTDVLSGVPSIVIGIFGYALVVKPQGHYSALAGGVAMAIIMLPTIIRTTEEMLKLVPPTLREGSLALGAPEWKTSLKVVLPAALSGIITGFMLALARASGETAPLLFTALGNDRFEVIRYVQGGLKAGISLTQLIPGILAQPVDSLPLTLFKYTQQPDVERVNQSWGVAFALLLFVLIINVAARSFVEYRAAKLKG